MAGGRTTKPYPADFVERAATMNNRELGKHYGVGAPCINQWRKIGGIHAARWKRPIPDDFREIAPGITVNAACARWTATHDTVKRWLAETGIPRFEGNQCLMPAEFPSRAGEPSADLAAEYGVAVSTIHNWRAKLGIPHPPSRRPLVKAVRKPGQRGTARPLPLPSVPQLEAGDAPTAAQYLRRYFSPVVKSEVIGKGKGRYFVGGKGLMDIPALIALAEAKGWDRLAWARIAA